MGAELEVASAEMEITQLLGAPINPKKLMGAMGAMGGMGGMGMMAGGMPGLGMGGGNDATALMMQLQMMQQQAMQQQAMQQQLLQQQVMSQQLQQQPLAAFGQAPSLLGGQLGGMQPQMPTGATTFQRLVSGFPGQETPTGRKIAALEVVPGHVKHDMLIGKDRVGRLIGPQGSTYKELQMKTSCNIFVLDKEGPAPGFSEEQRIVTLIGFEQQVAAAEKEITSMLYKKEITMASMGIGGAGLSFGPPTGYGGVGVGLGMATGLPAATDASALAMQQLTGVKRDAPEAGYEA